ncbi:MAG: hypothetical protein J7M06_00835, partial [Proteobacteria bacterium]|nr:hypothetical protein [Pseudomonadota bacterium]
MVNFGGDERKGPERALKVLIFNNVPLSLPSPSLFIVGCLPAHTTASRYGFIIFSTRQIRAYLSSSSPL